jgi:hypothetical protein
MKIDIRNALTINNCSDAIVLSTRLYNSAYSDNEIRMLYASAHACNMGIQLYDLIDQITSASLNSPDAIFKSLVKIFPSRTALDTRLQSGWFAQDALQSILKPGSVVASNDANPSSANNPGSVLSRDRTDDANMYLTFVAMGEVGTSLNRYGYNASDDPAAMGYAQSILIPFDSQALIKADASGAGCSLASGLLNMFDGIRSVITLVSGSTSASLNNILTNLETVTLLAGKNACTTDGFSSNQCDAAAQRLRYRASCTESDSIASFAGGIVNGINLGWQ